MSSSAAAKSNIDSKAFEAGKAHNWQYAIEHGVRMEVKKKQISRLALDRDRPAMYGPPKTARYERVSKCHLVIACDERVMDDFMNGLKSTDAFSSEPSTEQILRQVKSFNQKTFYKAVEQRIPANMQPVIKAIARQNTLLEQLNDYANSSFWNMYCHRDRAASLVTDCKKKNPTLSEFKELVESQLILFKTPAKGTGPGPSEDKEANQRHTQPVKNVIKDEYYELLVTYQQGFQLKK